MRRITRKKVVPVLLCTVLMLGFVSPHDPLARHFAPIQLAAMPLPERLFGVRILFEVGKDALSCKSRYINFFSFIISKKSFIGFILHSSEYRNISVSKNWLRIFEGIGKFYPKLFGEHIEISNKNRYEKDICMEEFIRGRKAYSDYLQEDRELSRNIKYNKLLEDLMNILIFTYRRLVTFLLSWPALDFSDYQLLKTPFEKLSLVYLILNLFNASRFLGKAWWIIGASVGGIAATSEAHALSLLSVRLSAIRSFLPAGLPGESVSDSKRQKRYNRGDGADAPATI